MSIPGGGSVSEAANAILWWHPASWLDGMSTKGEAPNLTERAAATKNAIVLQSQRRSTHKFHIYAMFFAPALLLIYIINMSFKKRPPAFYFLKHGFSKESICQWFPRIVHILRPSKWAQLNTSWGKHSGFNHFSIALPPQHSPLVPNYCWNILSWLL